jgi:transglutaminase-like putative cysteine protease
MLLCALLRARGIAARTAVGLVYVEGSQAFGYHMWTEAWIVDRWMPLDATVGRGGISAAYLKVSDTNFQGVDPLTTLLPVTKLLGRLKIGILEAR